MPKGHNTAMLRPGYRRSFCTSAMAILAPATFIASPAFAQSESAAAETDNSVPEIVVTAQRREERLIDVPAAVSMIDSEALQAASVQRLADLSSSIPNLTIRSSNSLASVVRIRGVGASSRNIGFDTRVGVYIDGIYLGQSPALNQDLVDIERVEVMRGPQGALFGKNTVAGAINIISRRPNSEAFSGQIRVRAGNYDLHQAMARINVPLTENIAATLSASRAKRDGYILNLFDDKTAGELNNTSYRGQLSADFGASNFLLTVDGLHKRERSDYGMPVSNSFGTGLDESAPGLYRINYDHLRPDVVDVFGVSMEGNVDLPGDLTLRSLSSYRKTKFNTEFDTDNSPLDLHYVDYRDRYKQATQELQIISPSGERLEYLVGLYYYWQKGSSYRAGVAGSLGYLLGLPPFSAGPTDGDVITNNVAVFANMTYDLTSKLKIGFGFRYSDEKKDVDWTIDGTNAQSFNIATGRFVKRHVDRDFSPSVTLTYALTSRFNAYARYAEGYKSGGFNLDFITKDVFPDGIEFDKESVKNYEVGLKGTILDGRANIALTAFWADYSDYQVNQLRDLGGGRVVFAIGNAAGATSKGLEFEGSVQATDALRFNVGIALLDATFSRFAGGGDAGADAAGNRLPNSSKLQFQIGADYEEPITSALKINAHVDYAHDGNQYTTPSNTRTSQLAGGETVPYGFVAAKGLMNARLGLAQVDDRWEINLWSRNLLDSHARADDLRSFFGGVLEYRTEPRTYGIELGARF